MRNVTFVAHIIQLSGHFYCKAGQIGLQLNSVWPWTILIYI